MSRSVTDPSLRALRPAPLTRERRRIPPLCGLALGLLLLLSLAACRSAGDTPAPDATPASMDGVTITGACAEPRAIEPAQPVSDDAWVAAEPVASQTCFRMSATDADPSGVGAETTFVFESAVALEPEDLARLLSVTPPLSFEVVPDDDGSASHGWVRAVLAEALTHRYQVVPTEPLTEGALYRFDLASAPDGGAALGRWSFQVREPLRVVHTIPGDQTSGVPLNSGVELTFSHADVTGVEELFSIEPPVEGSFDARKRVVVFVPEALEPTTLYTVRLDPGVAVEGTDLSLEEAYTFQFETGATESGEGAPPDEPRLRFSRHVWEQPPGETPALSMFGYGDAEEVAGSSVPITAYRFADVEAFRVSLEALATVPDWARFTRAAHRQDTADLATAASFEATLEPVGQYGEYLVRFPEPLEPGFYLVEADVDGTGAQAQVQAWLQVTEVATYAALSEPKLLVWVNDVASGVPIDGAVVRASGDEVVVDADGIAFVDTPDGLVETEHHAWGTRERSVGDLVVSAPDGRTAVVPLSDVFRGMRSPGYREWGSTGHPLYWRYLYPDRTLYRLSDTMRFWGVARAREGEAAVDEVTVELSGGDFHSADYGEAVLARTTVPLGPTGTYIGELSFSGASPGFYTLRTRVGGESISTTSIEVRDFVKPAYQLAVEPSAPAVFAGDLVTVEIGATFFEGSPVPNLTLRVDGDTSDTVTTDDGGRAAATYDAPERAGSAAGYGWSQVIARPALAEEGEITESASILVFPGARALDMAWDSGPDIGVISGTVRAVDLSRPDATQPDDYFAEPVPDQTVTAAITEVTYDRIETGEYYDFIDKVVRKTYRYVRVEEPGAIVETTTDEDGRFIFEIPLVAGRTYDVDVRVTDEDGRVTERRAYLGTSPDQSPLPQTDLVNETQGPYAIGDEVAVVMSRGGEPRPADGRTLFTLARGGIREHVLQGEPRLVFAFAEDHVPNIHVLGVHFNGSTYDEAAYGYNAALDQATRQLDIELASDRERYAPGDEVRVDVRVTDAEGQPAQAEVLLSGIDAAINDLQYGSGGGDAFLRSLYASVPSGVIRTYASHQYPVGAPGAEGGGGGDGRGDFRDLVLFETVATDDDGRGATTFTVPDNLTSWAITALGVTDDLHAGSGAGAVPVGLPLFVDITTNRSVLTADRPVVRLRAFGEALSAGDPVKFELYSETLMDEPVALDGEAFTGVDVPLPALSEGEHVLEARVSVDELEDMMERPLSAVPSRLVRTESRFAELGPGETFEAEGDGGQTIRLVLSDANRSRYAPDLLGLTTAFGDRLDRALARHVAAGLLTEQFGADAPLETSFRSEVYQTGSGGLALLPYGDADLALSARAAAVAPEDVGRQGLVQYFTAVVDDPDETRERVITALYGLAALGEPVLPAIQDLLGADDLSVTEQLHLGLGAAMLADETSAGDVYRGLLATVGERRGATARLNVGEDQDDVVAATALAAVLGAALADNLAPALYAYTTVNATEDILVSLEQVDYLARALPQMAAGPVRVAYTLHGEREEAMLGAGETVVLQLTPDALADLALEVLEGRAGVATTALVPVDPADVATDPDVSIERYYALQPQEPMVSVPLPPPSNGYPPDTGGGYPQPGPTPLDASRTEFVDGDLVRVNLAYTLGELAVDGCYQVSDLLPSGLRPVTQPYSSQAFYADPDLVLPYNIEGQRVSFCVFRDDELPELSYLARVVAKGAYPAEPALIQAMTAPESQALSESSAIEIR